VAEHADGVPVPPASPRRGRRGRRGIPGARERTYLLTSADAGRTIRVRVLAVNAEGAAAARSAHTERVTASGATRDTARPTVAGEPRPGEELTVEHGGWSGAPTSFAYGWQRCEVDVATCFAVTGATGKHLRRRLAGLGYRLRIRVPRRPRPRRVPHLRRLEQEHHDPADRLAAAPPVVHASVLDARAAAPVRRLHAQLGAGAALPRPRPPHGDLRARDESGLTSVPARRTFFP
jgi:hypothetical protein